MSDNLYELFRSRFAHALDRPFLAPPGRPVLSYGEADERTAAMAAVVRDHGVRPGDRVVAQVPKSIDAVLLYLACLRVGAVYVPLNEAYTATELAYFLGDATPALAVLGLDAATPPEAGATPVLTLGTHGEGSLSTLADTTPPDHALADVSPGALAAMCYTSGTTGRSKGAPLSVANLASNALALHRAWGWREGDVLLHLLPVFHVHGLFVALHGALLTGSTVIFLPRFDIAAVFDALPRATVVMGVPTNYVRLLADERLDHGRCRGVRLFTSGSAPLLPSTFASFAERTGHTIVERYGMTETGIITSNPLDGERLAGTVGHALPGIEVRVVGDDGAAVAPGATGIVEVRGPNVFPGYWQRPDATAAAFRPDGFFVTGDVGTLDATGRLTLVGRAGDLIITGGYNVYPKEIEAELDEMPGVVESAVIGVPHPDLGETVVALIVGEAPPLDAVRARLDSRLARFKHPRALIAVDELPRNAMGKVQKNVLRKEHEHLFG